jgi:hypothetical protein
MRRNLGVCGAETIRGRRIVAFFPLMRALIPFRYLAGAKADYLRFSDV